MAEQDAANLQFRARPVEYVVLTCPARNKKEFDKPLTEGDFSYFQPVFAWLEEQNIEVILTIKVDERSAHFLMDQTDFAEKLFPWLKAHGYTPYQTSTRTV